MHLAPSTLLILLAAPLLPVVFITPMVIATTCPVTSQWEGQRKSNHSQEIIAGDWHYSEETWTGLCSEGKRQSPVDLKPDTAKPVANEPILFIHYDHPVQANLTNNGHTVVLHVEQNCEVAVGAGGLRGLYQLDEIHFHWEAEHTLDGKRLPLEVHFVHHNTLYKNISQALAHEKGLAVIGVLFHEVDDEILNMVPVLEALEESADSVGDITALTQPFSPSALLPEKRNMFFRYHGSLTTPPCTESVIWTILHETVPISKMQLEKFRTVNSTAGLLDANYRPTQPLNSRTVYLVRDDMETTGSGNNLCFWLPFVIIISYVTLLTT